jgi:uncharacterized protein (TIRG00374 family)
VERIKKNLILALGLGVAVYLALAVASGLDDLRDALGSFRWSLVPAIFGLVAISYGVRYLRWSYYLRLLKVRMPAAQNVAIFVAGLSMTISPGKLGEVLKSVFIRQVNGAPIARTAPAVVAERATDGTGMLAWGLIGALAFSFGPGSLLLLLGATAVSIAVLRSRRLSVLAERALLRLPLLYRLAPHVRDFHGASNELLAVRPLIIGTAISFCSWGLEILAVYLCAVGIGAVTPFLVVVFIFVVGSISGALSMLPGGIGAAEAGMFGMFSEVAGLSSGISAALTFVIRLATLWFATFLGVAGLFIVRRVIGEPVDPDAAAIAQDAGAQDQKEPRGVV